MRKVERAESTATTAPTGGPAHYTVRVDGRDYSVAISGETATVNGRSYSVSMGAKSNGTDANSTGQTSGGAEVKAEMPGKVIRLLAQVGDRVESGEGVLVLEAMKMEVQITAPFAGTIIEISVAAGSQVAAGDVLACLD